MRGLNRIVRRLLPVPRGDYANDGFPVEHPHPGPPGPAPRARGTRRADRGS